MLRMSRKRAPATRSIGSKRARRTTATRRSKFNSKLMLRVARTAVLRTAETKFVGQSLENVQLFHNGGAAPQYVWLTNLCTTSVGSSQATRVGDDVWGVGVSIRLWLSNKLDRPNVMYRVFVIAVPADQQAAGNPANLFKGSSGNKMLDFIDTDRYKVRYHKLIQPASGDYSLESGATNRERSRMLKIWIPTKGRIKYATDNGLLPTYQKYILSLGIIAYDAFGSILTDNIASFAGVTRFYFKDP